MSTNQDTMRSVVWEGKPYHMSVKDVPKAKVEKPEDAVIQVTTAAICGTDLHTYHGIFGSPTPPWPMGHEAIGIVVEVGSGVTSVKVGDRVVIPDEADDGHFDLSPQPITSELFFGLGPLIGNLGGCQAEFVRCPNADKSLIPIPEGHHNELDYLFISDIWATAWTCLNFSGFQPGDTVAVFGAGPVGLLCAYSALLRGASKVYSIDHVDQRLEKAKSIGAIPINFTHSDPVEQILKLEPNGVVRSCDCCGEECVNDQLEPEQDIIIRNAVNLTQINGGIGVIGVYFAEQKSAGVPLADRITADISFPFSTFWSKNLTLRAGTVDPKLVAGTLVELVKSGKGKPSFIVSSEIGIEDAPEYYRRFSDHKETKVVIHFPEQHRGDGSDEIEK